MVAALWVQWSQYHNGGAENSMHFRPFALVSTSFLDAAKRQFVSLLCPLSVLALFRSAAWRDPALRLAWLTWAAGWVLAMGFVEDGPRLKHMNFFWSIQISTFCVFALSAMAAVRLMADATTRRPAILAMGLLALHAGFGVWMWKWYAFGEHAAR